MDERAPWSLFKQGDAAFEAAAKVSVENYILLQDVVQDILYVSYLLASSCFRFRLLATFYSSHFILLRTNGTLAGSCNYTGSNENNSSCIISSYTKLKLENI